MPTYNRKKKKKPSWGSSKPNVSSASQQCKSLHALVNSYEEKNKNLQRQLHREKSKNGKLVLILRKLIISKTISIKEVRDMINSLGSKNSKDVNQVEQSILTNDLIMQVVPKKVEKIYGRNND